jgi:hypothetical protein
MTNDGILTDTNMLMLGPASGNHQYSSMKINDLKTYNATENCRMPLITLCEMASACGEVNKF